MPGEKAFWSLIRALRYNLIMNKKVEEIIEDINSLSKEDKEEIFKIVFHKPLSSKDLELIKWTVDGIQEVRESGKKLDKINEILDNAKRRSEGKV